MKRFSIVFLMVMFVANTIVVSAWAKPCMMNNLEISQNSQKDATEVPPCHEASDTENTDSLKSDMQHCDGMCFCFHSSITQTPLVSDFTFAPVINNGAKTFVISNESMLSQDYSPTNPPPIFTF